MLRAFTTIFAALLGLAFGSFLNVCLSRWPASESIVKPRSHCRACNRPLDWWENIPLLSWLALRGRCHGCGAAISIRYPLIEAAVAILWAAHAWLSIAAPARSIDVASFSPYFFASFVAGFVLLWLLVALAALDAEHLWLPDFITLPAIAVGLLLKVLYEEIGSFGRAPRPWHALWMGIVAAATAAALILAIRWLYWLIRRREGIGLGDAKLMALLAAWLGLPAALLAFALGSFLGAIVGVVMLASRPKQPASSQPSWALSKLPLGTFLCIGGIIAALWGPRLIALYLHWAGF